MLAAVNLVVHILDELVSTSRASRPLVLELILALAVLTIPSPHIGPVLVRMRQPPSPVLFTSTLSGALHELDC
jgi:hypothetical protein